MNFKHESVAPSMIDSLIPRVVHIVIKTIIRIASPSEKIRIGLMNPKIDLTIFTICD